MPPSDWLDSQKPKLILASQSPRRRQLLFDHGFDFEVVPPDPGAESGTVQNESPAQLVERLAFQKAKNVASRTTNGYILGSDTVAECNGQILGKPRDRADAKRMLTIMSGQAHRVLSGVCLWERPSDLVLLDFDRTKLVMEKLTDSELEDYLNSNDWRGKAGAFGFQDGLEWIRIEEGSESNVVGLPMELLMRMINRFRADAVHSGSIVRFKSNIIDEKSPTRDHRP